MTLRDAKYAALQTLTSQTEGTINDLELQWLEGLTSSTGTIQGLYDVWLTNLGYTAGTVKDRLYALMGDEGYTGTLNDRLLQFWLAGGTVSGGFNAPSDLVATAISDTEIDLAWSDNSDNETGFRVERSPNGTSGWTEITTTAANATTYSDTGLTAATEYFYRVITEGDGGESAPSNVASDTTDAAAETDFIFTVTTTGAAETFTIPCQNIGTFDAVIDWGDAGPTSAITTYNDGDLAHVYASAGDHQIRISGTFPNIYFNNGGDKLKVKSVENLGVVGWTQLNNAFYGCSNMTSFVVGNTDTSAIGSLNYFLFSCTGLTGDLDLRPMDVGACSGFQAMINRCSGITSLNLSGWDTSNVTNPLAMARDCTNLQSINMTGWDTSAFGDAQYMFAVCPNLSGVELSTWNIASMTGAIGLLAVSNNAITNTEYDATLIAWQAQAHQPNVPVDFGDAKYSAGAAATARAALVSDGWSVTDGGPV